MVKKRGQVSWELIRTVLFVILLVTMIIVAVVWLKGGGGSLLDAVSDIMRFGR